MLDFELIRRVSADAYRAGVSMVWSITKVESRSQRLKAGGLYAISSPDNRDLPIHHSLRNATKSDGVNCAEPPTTRPGKANITSGSW